MNDMWNEGNNANKGFDFTQPPEEPKKKSKLIKIIIVIVIIIILALLLLVGIKLVKDKKETVDDTLTEVETTPLETSEVEDNAPQEVDVPEVENEFTSNLFGEYNLADNESFIQYLTSHAEFLNALAIGYTTMASFLEEPETIVDVEAVKGDMAVVDESYQKIFKELQPTEEDALDETALEAVTKMAEEYVQIYTMRVEQSNGLQEGEPVTINYVSTSAEAVTMLWKEIINRHNDYGKVTELDFTGGLGVLMQ